MLRTLAQKAISALIRNNHLFINHKKIGEIKYLNVGCGINLSNNFINLDYFWRPGLDICWDITKKIPIAEGSLEGIYTEHCLEHIDYTSCLTVLKDFYRMLTDGGTIRIIVPDAGLYLDLYQKAAQGNTVSFPYLGKGGEKDMIDDSTAGFTPMMAVNRIFRGYGHRFAFDYTTLRNMLAHSGFSDIQKATYRQGQLPALLIDSQYRQPQSLYVEAVKKINS